MSKAPLRAVTDIVDIEGPRGGIINVLILECGCFVTRRLKRDPPLSVPCIACFVKNYVEGKKESLKQRLGF